MAGNFLYSKFRETFKLAINAIDSGGAVPSLTLNTARVFLGWHTRLGATDGACKDAEDNGPFAVIGPMISASRSQRGSGPVTCNMKLFVFKDKASDWDGIDIDDLNHQVIDSGLTETRYNEQLVVMPSEIALTNLSYLFRTCKGLVISDFRITVPDTF